jgi:hypothetical protein
MLTSERSSDDVVAIDFRMAGDSSADLRQDGAAASPANIGVSQAFLSSRPRRRSFVEEHLTHSTVSNLATAFLMVLGILLVAVAGLGGRRCCVLTSRPTR